MTNTFNAVHADVGVKSLYGQVFRTGPWEGRYQIDAVTVRVGTNRSSPGRRRTCRSGRRRAAPGTGSAPPAS